MGNFFQMLFSPSDAYDISKISVGFSKEQVVKLFGKPHGTTTGSNSREKWTYDVPFRIFVMIDFDANGRVSGTYRST